MNIREAINKGKVVEVGTKDAKTYYLVEDGRTLIHDRGYGPKENRSVWIDPEIGYPHRNFFEAYEKCFY